MKNKQPKIKENKISQSKKKGTWLENSYKFTFAKFFKVGE